MFVGNDTLEQEQLKMAVIASTINWKVMERFKNKFKYPTNPELVYERGLKRKPNPFHKHVRINLDKCTFCGISTPDEMIDAGLKLTAKQIKDIKLAKEETEDGSID